jgi:hypothetical protein
MLNSRLHILALCTVLSVTVAPQARAEMPRIIAVETSRVGMGWRIDVTLRHPDTGWDHYADGWEVLDEHGKRLGYRELMHPHVEEQPFTRSLINLMIPDGVRTVYIRAKCSKLDWSSETLAVELAQ